MVAIQKAELDGFGIPRVLAQTASIATSRLRRVLELFSHSSCLLAMLLLSVIGAQQLGLLPAYLAFVEQNA